MAGGGSQSHILKLCVLSMVLVILEYFLGFALINSSLKEYRPTRHDVFKGLPIRPKMVTSVLATNEPYSTINTSSLRTDKQDTKQQKRSSSIHIMLNSKRAVPGYTTSVVRSQRYAHPASLSNDSYIRLHGRSAQVHDPVLENETRMASQRNGSKSFKLQNLEKPVADLSHNKKAWTVNNLPNCPVVSPHLGKSSEWHSPNTRISENSFFRYFLLGGAKKCMIFK